VTAYPHPWDVADAPAAAVRIVALGVDAVAWPPSGPPAWRQARTNRTSTSQASPPPPA
jgi:hypothetical protein